MIRPNESVQDKADFLDTKSLAEVQISQVRNGYVNDRTRVNEMSPNMEMKTYLRVSLYLRKTATENNFNIMKLIY